MPFILHVSFCNPNPASEASHKAAWERAHMIAKVEGLLGKIWIAQPEKNAFGGVYLFVSKEAATAYLKGPIPADIQEIPGMTDFSTNIYEVEDELSAVTRGPIV
jgi:hypothetical protein